MLANLGMSRSLLKKAKRALPSWKLSGYDVMSKLDLGHVFGVMSGECGTQQRKLLARLQSPKSLGSLLLWIVGARLKVTNSPR
jgi:hypothetical protein